MFCVDWSGIRSEPTTECCDIAAGPATAPVPARVPAEHGRAAAAGHRLSAGGSVRHCRAALPACHGAARLQGSAATDEAPAAGPLS